MTAVKLLSKLDVFDLSQTDKRWASLSRRMAMSNMLAVDLETGIRLQGGYTDPATRVTCWSIMAPNGIDTIHRFSSLDGPQDHRQAMAYAERFVNSSLHPEK